MKKVSLAPDVDVLLALDDGSGAGVDGAMEE